MKKLLIGLTLFTGLISTSNALDIITAPIQVFTKPCYNYLRYDYASAFCYSQKLTYSLVGNGKGHGDLKMIAYIVALPFTLLDENENHMSLNAQNLIDQGYLEEEIAAYKNDLELVEAESKRLKINNAQDAKRLIDELINENQLNPITIEIMGL